MVIEEALHIGGDCQGVLGKPRGGGSQPRSTCFSSRSWSALFLCALNREDAEPGPGRHPELGYIRACPKVDCRLKNKDQVHLQNLAVADSFIAYFLVESLPFVPLYRSIVLLVTLKSVPRPALWVTVRVPLVSLYANRCFQTLASWRPRLGLANERPVLR